MTLGTAGFEKIAPYLQDPLVLIGFALLLFFGLARVVVKSGLLKPVAGAKSYRILMAILLYGFLLGVLIIALGFGLKHRAMSEADQQAAINLLKGEFDANASTIESLRGNTVTVMALFVDVSQVVRKPEIRVMSTLFPAANIQSGDRPLPKDLAIAALISLLDQKLDKNQMELRKGDEAARLIVQTIGRTRSTIVSLTDPAHQRYVIGDRAWTEILPVLPRVHLSGVPEFQRSYSDMRRVRTDYDVVCNSVLTYLDTLVSVLNKTRPIDVDRLTMALTQERQSLALLLAYSESLTTAVAKIKDLQGTLATIH